MEWRWCGGLLWILLSLVTAESANGTTDASVKVEKSANAWVTVLVALIAVICFVVAFVMVRSRCCGAFPKPRPLSEVESDRRKQEMAKKGLTPTPVSPSSSSVYCLPTRLKHPYPPPSYHSPSPGGFNNVAFTVDSSDSLPSDVVLRIHPDQPEKDGPTSPPPSYTSGTPGESPAGSRIGGPKSPPPSYGVSPTTSNSTPSPPSTPTEEEPSGSGERSNSWKRKSTEFVSVDL